MMQESYVEPRLISDLGLSAVETWRSGLSLASGLCVVGGGTGSGLTTTLHATARELKSLGRKVAFIGSSADLPREPFMSFDPADYRPRFFPFSPWHVGAIRDATAQGADALIILRLPVENRDFVREAVMVAADGRLVVAEMHSTPRVEDIVKRLCGTTFAHDGDRAAVFAVLRCIMGQARVRVGSHGRATLSEAVCLATATEAERILTEEAWWPTIDTDGHRHSANPG